MRSCVTALLVVASFVLSAAAQTPKPSARIRGRVITAVTGRPLLLATVALSGGNPYVRRTVKTDSNGSYEFVNVPAGRYSLAASRAGYLEQNFDQPSPFARYRLLELAEGEQLDGMDFRLHRGAVVTGVITDEAGDPLPDASVQVMREQFGPTGRMLRARTQTPIRTDDEGRYRVYALPPGMYVVTATVDRSDDLSLSFGRTYYPGTMNESEAQTLRVDFGQEAVANFSMIPARRARVSGIVRDSQGRPASGMRMTLNEPSGAGYSQIDVSMLSGDGSFTFEHVLPGRYLLHVRPSRLGQTPPFPVDVESATTYVSVTGDDVSDLILTTAAGFTLSGRVTLDGSTAPLATKGLTMSARVIDPALQSLGSPMFVNSPVDEAGRFRIVGLRGKVRVTGGGAGWFSKRVLVKGIDVTTSGFDVSTDLDGIEVVLTNQVTTITGTARDAGGVSRKDYIVAFFPVGQFGDEERARRQRTIRPDPDGIYRIRNLPPGDYLAVAVPVMSLPIDGEWDPAFAERVRPQAIGFKLAEGQSLALNLTLFE